MTRASLAALTLAAVAFSARASSQPLSNPPSRDASHSTLPKSDRRFLEEAARGGLAEVELGRLAANKASRPEVQAFGQHMVDDHGKANEDIKKLAESKSVTVPSGMDAKEENLKKRLSALSGDAFDRAYVAAMLEDHKHDVVAFEKKAMDARDLDVLDFAKRTLPTLEEHLSLVRELSKTVNGGSDSASKRM